MPDKLIEALRSGKLATVRTILRQNPKAARHARPVVEAGRLAFQPALALLHRNGADLNAMFRGYRALHSLLQEDPHDASGAPSRARLACLNWLLAHGADPEQTGAWPPARAIIIAAFAGRADYVRRLKEAGAKIDGFVGAALGDRRLVEKTLRGRPEFARERDSGGLTALQCAAASRLPKANTLEVARMLLDAGADIDAETESWGHAVTAAHFAASSKSEAIFALLLDRGADPTAALVPALWNGGQVFAEMAHAHGADLNKAKADGQPLLNNLIRWGQIPPTFWLLSQGASPNLADERGWTAVHQAASRGNERLLRAVLDAGGDVRRRDKQGMTPVDVAKSMRRGKLLAMMS